uniref:Ubiquitin-conjugating enzyme E2 J1 n=1 Tax=Maylandia zebra TaxID=106582 RepID=A0A3P9DBT8_9CICH
MKEAAELRDPTEHYHAQPLEDNLFEWHFSVRGPPDSDFDGGVYHGRIILPPEYPMKPPSIILLTPNGRFEVGKKICLSISGHHPETWQPSWSIRTALIAIIGFMPTKGEGAIGSLDYTPEERRALAKKSQDFCCETCGCTMRSALLDLTPNSNPGAEDHTAKELAQQINFKVQTLATAHNLQPARHLQSYPSQWFCFILFCMHDTCIKSARKPDVYRVESSELSLLPVVNSSHQTSTDMCLLKIKQ